MPHFAHDVTIVHRAEETRKNNKRRMIYFARNKLVRTFNILLQYYVELQKVNWEFSWSLLWLQECKKCFFLLVLEMRIAFEVRKNSYWANIIWFEFLIFKFSDETGR